MLKAEEKYERKDVHVFLCFVAKGRCARQHKGATSQPRARQVDLERRCKGDIGRAKWACPVIRPAEMMQVLPGATNWSRQSSWPREAGQGRSHARERTAASGDGGRARGILFSWWR